MGSFRVPLRESAGTACENDERHQKLTYESCLQESPRPLYKPITNPKSHYCGSPRSVPILFSIQRYGRSVSCFSCKPGADSQGQVVNLAQRLPHKHTDLPLFTKPEGY